MNTVIFLNGEFPSVKIVNSYLKKTDYIIAADGGCNYLKSENILPDIVIGDLDSAKKSSLKFFEKKNIRILKIEDQETTDFEKCLIYCREKKLNLIKVFGAMSMRADHTMNNFSVMKRYCKKLDIKLVTEEFEIFFINKNFNFKYKKGGIISFLPLPSAKGITTTGLKYSLKNESLEFGRREGTLNNAISDNVSISFKNGSLLLFKKHFI
jgi:thiamine pyrophosphokinase